MRTISLFLAAISLTILPLQAATIADGLYSVSKTNTDLSVSTDDGERIYLAKPLPDKIKLATIISQRNDNSVYLLEITVDKFSVTPWDIVLVLDGRAVRFFGQGGNESGVSTEAQIFDQHFADLAATFFNTTVKKRQHPGHQFVGSFLSKKKIYAVGEDIIFTFRLTNCGTTAFNYWSWGFLDGKFDGDPSPAFTFSAAGNDNEPVQNVPNHFSEHPIDMFIPGGVLKPQESRSIDINLKDYLRLNKAGIYEIRGSCSYTLVDSSHQTIWKDFATEDFEVQIK